MIIIFLFPCGPKRQGHAPGPTGFWKDGLFGSGPSFCFPAQAAIETGAGKMYNKPIDKKRAGSVPAEGDSHEG